MANRSIAGAARRMDPGAIPALERRLVTFDDTDRITIEDWLTEAQSAIDFARSIGWSDFAGRYEVVIRAAEAQLGTVNDRLNRLIHEPKHMQQHEFLIKYIDAMSVTVDGSEVFLPSFSDQCLLETMKGSSTGLSPFRGLYYSWKLSEAAARSSARERRPPPSST